MVVLFLIFLRCLHAVCEQDSWWRLWPVWPVSRICGQLLRFLSAVSPGHVLSASSRRRLYSVVQIASAFFAGQTEWPFGQRPAKVGGAETQFAFPKEKLWTKESWLWAGLPWRMGDAVKWNSSYPYSGSSEKGIFFSFSFAPLRCWNISGVPLGFHKGVLIHEWSLNWCFWGRACLEHLILPFCSVFFAIITWLCPEWCWFFIHSRHDFHLKYIDLSKNHKFKGIQFHAMAVTDSMSGISVWSG